jgi:CRISPR/Cas system-associated exonuclease Cas4 (RecB family)
MAKSRALLNVLNAVNKEELAVERQFLNELQTSIELTDRKNARKPSQTVKPSSLHCIRNMYYQVSGAEPQSEGASSALIGICESGTDRHDRIQRAVMGMKDNNIDCEYVNVAEYVKSHDLQDIDVVSQQGNETKLYHKKLNMSFLCDGIIKYHGKYYILEIKTETSYKFLNRENVNPDHILQGTAYSLALGIDNVLFLYESRDNCLKKTYMLHVTDDMRGNLQNKIYECLEYVQAKVLPPKPSDVSKKTCTYCNYSGRCKQDGK